MFQLIRKLFYVLKNKFIPVYVVEGTSMKPSYNHGDLVLLTTAVDLDVNDVVVYAHPSNRFIIHRVKAITSNGYITHGDNNIWVDHEIVKKNQVLGKVLVRFPKAGYFHLYLRQKFLAFQDFVWVKLRKVTWKKQFIGAKRKPLTAVSK